MDTTSQGEKREERVTEDLRNFTQVLTLWQERKVTAAGFQTKVVEILESMEREGKVHLAYQCFITIVAAVPKAIAQLAREVGDFITVERLYNQYKAVEGKYCANWRKIDEAEFRGLIFSEIRRCFLLLMIRQAQVVSYRDDRIDDASTKLASPLLPAFLQSVQAEDVRKKADMMKEKGTMNVGGKATDVEPDDDDREEEEDA